MFAEVAYPLGALYLPLLSPHSLGKGTMVMLGLLSLRWGISISDENAKKTLVKVELFFPLTHQVWSVDCDEGIQAPQRPLSTLWVLGDSPIQGLGSESLSAALSPRLTSLLGFEVITQVPMGSLGNRDIVQDLKTDLPIFKSIVG